MKLAFLKKKPKERLASVLLLLLSKPKPRRLPMQTLSNEMFYPATLAFLTPGGNPASVQSVSWETTEPGLLEIRGVSPSQLSAELWPADGASGVCELIITADVDLGDGVKNLVSTFGVEIRPAEASQATLTLGDGIPKP